MSKNYFYAIATLVGTVVGAGIFALPFVISQSGIVTLFIFLPILVLIQYYLHKMYAEIVLSTKTEHRIPGYTEIYAGKKYKNIASFFSIVGAYGSLLAYIILGGIFLHALLGNYFGGIPFVYSVALFSLESLIVLFGLRMIAGAEFFMTIFLIIVVLIITIKSAGSISASNFSLVNWSKFFLPYGPIFFSVGGLAAIPAVCRLLKKEKEKIKSVIFWGTLIPPIITIIFVTVVVGVTGINTTPDTLIGLRQVFSDGVVTFALIFGLLSIMTSFLVISQAVREVYWWDFKMNKNFAWFIACGIPLILFFLGIQNITKVVSFTGAITGGVGGIILIYLSFKVQTKAQRKSIIKTKISRWVAISLSSLFALGLLNEIAKLF